MLSAAAVRLELNASEIGEATALLSFLRTPPVLAAPRRELWPHGISGDFPLLCADASSVEALPLLGRWLLLKSCGFESELVYLSSEQGEYRRPAARKIADALSRRDLEALFGSRGGVHVAGPDAADAVRSRAVYSPGEAPRRFHPLEPPCLSRPRLPGTVPDHAQEGEAFCFTVLDDLPGRAWQLPLSNERFGAILADVGPAALWQENAREMRLTAPMEELRDTNAPVRLWVEKERGPVSLFAANDGRRCLVHFLPGCAVWEKELDGQTVSTTVFVPPEDDALVLLIEGAAGLPLRFALGQRGPPGGGSRSRARCAALICPAQLLQNQLPPGLSSPGRIYQSGITWKLILLSFAYCQA